jgi:septal ring factor EnvC (AmiA/AmiB activator)
VEPEDADDVAPADPAIPARASGTVVNWRDFFVQLVIVTAGVLIALLLQGLVDWQRGQALVREARANIRQELQDNIKEIDGEIAGFKRRRANLENALQLANDLLASGKSDINQIDVGSSLAGLTAASWRSAERTGALALMEYRDVQALSGVYDAQDLYVAQQRRSLERVAGAMAAVAKGPHAAPRADLEGFRRDVLALLGDLTVERQLAEQLSESYKSTVADVFE